MRCARTNPVGRTCRMGSAPPKHRQIIDFLASPQETIAYYPVYNKGTRTRGPALVARLGVWWHCLSPHLAGWQA